MRSTQRYLLAALAVILPAHASTLHAQVADKKGLTLDGARRVIAAAIGEATKRNTTGVIAVVDEGGNTMALERLDNTFAAGANISIGKARTAVLFKRPTKVFEDIIRNGRTPMVALNDFTPLQGGVPIVVDGQVVGGVGVSGAASAQEDEDLALAGATGLTSKTASGAAAPVEFFAGKDVAAAFAKGAVLLDGTGRNYMVHASRREKAGQAELHELDTDVIYVLGGSATFVTGGTVVDGKTIEPREIRGASIDGGDTRVITKGDVITVPNGTPHWFKEVKGPLTYYVVKVRADAGGTTWAAR
ncbi:MAG: heme-binding protein [Gemmatimonadales bacterium]